MRPDPFENEGSALGTAFEPLPASGFLPLSHSVGRVCNSSGSSVMELGVRLSSPGGAGTLHSLSVTYTIDGSTHSLTLPGEVGLCPGSSDCLPATEQ